ncbi:hypothetical protein FDZ74_15945, partial [bacterium]
MLRTKNFRTLFSLLALLGLAFNLMAPTGVRAAPGDPRILSGVVSDGTPDGHTWPLYARIEVSDGVGDPITVFTHPVSGAYSVTLSEGTQYTLTINAVQPGYQPLTQTVTAPANDLVMDFGLQVEDVFCEAQGYALVDHWTENFDGVTAPALPANWATQPVDGQLEWQTQNLVNEDPNDYPAQSSPNVAFFDGGYGSARLYPTTSIDMTALANQHLTFWMFQNGDYPNTPAALQVQVSIDNGQNWESVGPEFDRYGTASTWLKRAVDLSAYAGQTGLMFGFLART